ncbi:hypothetical protein [Paenibacillus sp. LC231]|uniref:hypothetical protein n=1 Tax=unclassified Paenibacillus TaxID=185978 RepID=UPI00094227FE|nr:hypothetical protein [Paenibacillus sp. LC231]
MIFDNVFIGKSSFIRDNSIIGTGSKIGHCCEVVSSLILNNSSITHYCGISSSIIGSNVHFGAYISTASVLLNESPIVMINKNKEKIKLGISKFGSVIGSNCKIGSYVLLNPGVIIEPNCLIFPQISLRTDYYPENSKIYIPNYHSLINTAPLNQF